VTVHRAYYGCAACGQTTYPLDEWLGVAEGQEQGRLGEKWALVAVLVPSPQAPQVCQPLLGSERQARGLRRVALREAQRLTPSPHRHPFPRREQERSYLQVEGQLWPTREPRQSAEDQGYREAKAGGACSQHDGAEVSKERQEILHKVRQAKITDSEEFRGIFAQVSQQAHGEQAAEGIVLADGARWLWLMGEDLLPHAIQILDFSQAKHSLWEAGKLIYGEGSAFVAPGVKEQETCLWEDKGEQVICPPAVFPRAPARSRFRSGLLSTQCRPDALRDLSTARIFYRVGGYRECRETHCCRSHERTRHALECH
jgi:hypothetical protein